MATDGGGDLQDSEIVRLMRSTDPAEQLKGERALVDQYRGRLMSLLVRRFGLDGDAAEELALLVVGNAVERIAQLREPAKLGGWLCSAAVNAAISAHRREKRAPESPAVHPAKLLGIAGPPPEIGAAEAREWQRIQIRHLDEVVEALNTRYRDVWIWLTEGLTHAEIAMMMGITLNNAHQLKHRTLAAVRRELARRGVPLDPPARGPK